MKADQSEHDLRRRVVGKFLREKRLRASLTQWDVANHLQYSTAQFISNWERGVSLPPLEALPKLAGLFGIPGREIIEVMHNYQEQMLKLSKKQLVDIFRQYGRQA
jgi:transcriptional regulator with XRE-family HTH domain